jgi:hypothetical protein
LILSFVFLSAVAVPAQAATVSVGCAGAAGTFDFSTLTQALQANPAGNVIINVSGVCTEAVIISSMPNLSIIGAAGAALVDPGDAVPNFLAVMEVDDSQNVTIQNLAIQLASRPTASQIPGVTIQNSTVNFRGGRIEGAGGSDGIDMVQSTVRLFGNVVIENNNDGQGAGEGIFVQGPSSTLTLRRDAAGNCPIIQGNGDNGILLTATGALVTIPAVGGCATIQNNGQAGIFAQQGANVRVSASQNAPSTVQIINNGFGVVAVVGSHFGVNGPVLIQGNTGDGVRLRNASGDIGPAIDGPAGPSIQQNGTASTTFTTAFCCALPAGISVANNSDLDISAGTVANNSAPGLLVQDNSSARVIGTIGSLSITQNPVGISVTNVSTAALFLAPSVTGNTGSDLACGPDSVGYGDLTNVGKNGCAQFKAVANPGKAPKAASKPLP